MKDETSPRRWLAWILNTLLLTGRNRDLYKNVSNKQTNKQLQQTNKQTNKQTKTTN